MIYTLFDSLLEPVFVLNNDGHIIYANETAATICGSNPRKIVRSKMTLSQAILFEENFEYLTSLTAITTPTPYREVKFSTESYENGKAQITIQQHSPNSESLEYIVFFRDVTLEERLQKKYRAELEQKESYIYELQSARNQLEIYNKDLESIVQKRTAEIQSLNVLMKALLDSLNQAFFVFDQNGVCAPLYSKACLEILDLNPSGQKIWNVLKIPAPKIDGFRNWLFTVFTEMLPFEDLKPLGPDRIPHGSKSVSIDYFPIRDQDGKIEKIVCVGSDVTDIVLAKAQAEKDREKVQSILKMIQNKKELGMFLLETKNQLVFMNSEFEELKNNITHSRDSFLRILHTIKGGAATFSYNVLKETAHHLEEKMLEKDEASPTSTESLELKNKIEIEFESIFSFYKEVFGDLNSTAEDNFVFSSNEINALLSLQKVSDIKTFIEEKVYFQPVNNLVGQFPIVIDKTAQLLGKNIHPLVVKNESTLVPNKIFEPFFNSFIHVLRNSVDHGVENPKLRQNLGKDSFGTLSIEFSVVERGRKFLQIKYRDDGQGINPSRIRAKLIKNRVPHSHLSDDQVIYFIFNSLFSTREEVTETSGRGVGLDAVKYEVDQLGGSINIKTELGKYTEFAFLLPFNVQSDNQKAA